jgi:hypothetical protein
MNKFVAPADLHPISKLIRHREEQINVLLHNLRAIDVRNAAEFTGVKASIRRAVLLQPVVFGAPELVSRGYKSGNSTLMQQMAGRIRKAFIHKVAFPFSGSKELFDYAPETFGYFKTETGLIRPQGNRIIVELNVPYLSMQKAVLEAQGILSLTMQFINSNNAVAEIWSRRTKDKLDRRLEEKREELMKLYGIRC